MTKFGFFSLVCARQGDGESYQPVDPNMMMLRARSRDHLEKLRANIPDLIGNAEVLVSATADYPVRLILEKPVAVKLVAKLVDEIETDNFKRSAAEIHGNGSDYVHALHSVWSTMRRLDEREKRK